MAAPEPQATTAPAYTPVLTDLLRLLRAPFAPRGVFEEQRDAPTFWLPWIVLSVLFAVVMVFMLPISIQAAHAAAAAKGAPLPDSALGLIRISTLLGPAIGLLIGSLIGAVILYFVLMISGAEARFKGLMTVSIFAAPVAVLQTAVTTLMLRMRGVESILTPADAQQSLGLDLLFPVDFTQAHKALAALLRGIGPFEIWVLVVTAVGLMALERVAKNKAWTAAIVSFVVGLVIRAGSALVFKAG
jgi:hypothetical protein